MDAVELVADIPAFRPRAVGVLTETNGWVTDKISRCASICSSYGQCYQKHCEYQNGWNQPFHFFSPQIEVVFIFN